MSFATTMTALKDKVDGLIANRVAKFAYTQQAYNSDDVNGVTEYAYSAEQNIPTSSASVLKVNETVLTKGWRTQASAITRMLMNHFLGRTSYNLNKTVDFLKAFMLAIENNMGVAEGFATLDENTQLPLAQLTPSVVVDCGEWDADTNTPELEIGEGRKGDTYRVSVTGTQNLGEGLVTYRIGDTIMYNGSIWVKTATGTVSSVNAITPNETGNVILTGEDINTTATSKLSITQDSLFNKKLSFSNLLGRFWVNTGLYLYPSIYIYTEKKDSVAYDKYKNKFYFCCNDNTYGGIYESKDGIEWNLRMSKSTIGANDLFCIRLLFIYDEEELVYNKTRILLTTSDGIVYSDNNFNSFTSAYQTTSSYFRASYPEVRSTYSELVENDVLVCSNDGILESDDFGATWYVTDSTWVDYHDFTCNKYGVQTRGGHYLSNTGWQTNSLLAGTNPPKTFLAKGMSFCYGATGLWYCTEGWASTSFTACSNGSASVTSMTINDIECGFRFVCATQGKGLIYSVDGKTWYTSNITSGNYARVKYANGIFVAIPSSANTRFKYSFDGVTWTDCDMLTHTYSPCITYSNGVWIAYDNTDTSVIYSINGITWLKCFKQNLSGQEHDAQFIHGTLFWTGPSGLIVSSVDTLIERGWVNID